MRARLAGAIGLLMVMGLPAGCATTSSDGSFPAQQALLGKSEQEMLACAGEPKARSVTGEETTLTYHRKAPVFEESFATSKASMPCPRHACEAVVMLKGDRVVEAQYHPTPQSLGGCAHCEEIFRNCVP